MRNHFNTAHRWFYIIVPIVGGGHQHYLVSDIVDENSLYQTQNIYDFKYDNYCVADYADVDFGTCYCLDNIVDIPSYYLVNNIVNSDSSYVILYRGDYYK